MAKQEKPEETVEEPEQEAVEVVPEVVAEPVAVVEADEPVTLAEVAAKGGEFFKALRRLGTRPVREAIGKGADTVIDALDGLAGDQKPKRKDREP